MEENINIAAILKDKPNGLILYSPIFGYCTFCYVREDTNDICVKKQNGVIEYFNSEGLYFAFGEVMLFPSKEMRDWRKLDWKKGYVLVNEDGDAHVIFEGFDDDTYETFNGNYYLENNVGIVSFVEHEGNFLTSEFDKANKENAQKYISTIEECMSGKHNRETKEIEKTQQEIKNGDIVCISGMGYLAYGIVKSIDNSSKKLEYYVLNDMRTLKFEDLLSFEDKQTQPITETQQIIFFDALAKEGKYWDSNKTSSVE